MAIWSIPVNFSTPDFSFQIDLDGTIFGFRFCYNERTDRWSMSISDGVGNPIVSGIAVVTNWKLLQRFKTPGLPPGQLFTMDITGGNTEPGEVNFGDTVLLCYSEALSV